MSLNYLTGFFFCAEKEVSLVFMYILLFLTDDDAFHMKVSKDMDIGDDTVCNDT